MLFDLYCPRIIPYCGYSKNKTDYSGTFPIFAEHSEIPRSEYSYQWNTDGIRSIDFSTKPKIVVLGCSITLGQGLPVELRWSDILSRMIDEPIGNISYSGAAINKNISSFFGMVNQYDYVPEIVVCHFAGFERFYFINPYSDGLQDWYINYKPKKTKVSAPWDYEEILPYEWVYFNNLDHIKMLESFCSLTKTKLIWSCWSANLNQQMDLFLQNNFKNYVVDATKKFFPSDFEFGVGGKNMDELYKSYRMIDWHQIMCHSELMDCYPDIFDYAYDYQKIAGRWGPGAHWPHPGVHQHQHIAEFYYSKLKEMGWM